MELYANNAHGIIQTGIGPGDASVTLEVGDGALFPNPTAADFFRCSLERLDGSASEIVFCSNRSGDVLTIERAKENTSAAAFSAGDRVRLRPTAGMLEAIGNIVAAERSELIGWAGSGTALATQFGVSQTSTGGTRTYQTMTSASHRASKPGVIHTATAAGNILGYGFGINASRVTRGNGTARGGFDCIWRFGVVSDLAGMYGFWGLDDNNSATYSGGTPEGRTTTEQIGVGWSSGSSAGGNFFVYHNDGAGPMASVDTGIARNETDVFRLRLRAGPNAAGIELTFVNETTGETFEATFTTEIPASTSFLVGRHTASGVVGGAIVLFGYWRYNVNQGEPVI